MPSRRSPRVDNRVLTAREACGATRKSIGHGLLATVVALSVLPACSGGGAATVGTPATPTSELVRLTLSEAEREFLVDPLASYPLVLDGRRAAELNRLYRLLVDDEDVSGVESGLKSLLDEDPGLHPAGLLSSQLEFALGRAEEAFERLRPVAEELPDYGAAQLLLGAVAERRDDVVAAHGAYFRVSEQFPLAERRLEETGPRALEILDFRLEDALQRGRLEEAESSLETIHTWAPDTFASFDAARRVAAFVEDGPAEMEALRGILELGQQDERPTLERLAGLEMEFGEPRQGVEIFRQLVEHFPEDPTLQDRLEEAKFGWRVSTLPAEVRQVGRRNELTRGDFAVLLYWLVPGVRYARSTQPRIAADILEHPNREQIARVLNLDLLSLDEKLHRFSPLKPVTRVEVLGGLLRSIGQQPERVACVRGVPLNARPSRGWVCEASSRCRMINESADCLPSARISGQEALQLIRRSLSLMTGSP